MRTIPNFGTTAFDLIIPFPFTIGKFDVARNSWFTGWKAQNQNRSAVSPGMEAGYNGFISFLQSKKLTAQKWQGGHF
jgi:hypothetical protein